MQSAAHRYNVAIVGGGLAGLASAILLARSGRSVVLYEKRRFPFHRVCGEYISMESWDFLLALGLQLPEMQVPRIDTLGITTSLGADVRSHLPLGGFGISRYRLDAELARLARDLNVRIVENAAVADIEFSDGVHTVRTASESVTASVVIGAYGKLSALDKRLGRDFIRRPAAPRHNYVAVKYHVQADLPDNLIELHIFDDGYCGISRIEEEGRYCMAYLTTAASLQRCNGDISTLERSVLSQNATLRRYLREFPVTYRRPLVIANINFNRKNAVQDHVLLAGDAAGLITPLCGNGMSMALHASYLLAPLINDFLDGKFGRDIMERYYENAWRRTFDIRLRVGNALQKLFFGERSAHYALQTLRHFPTVLERIVTLTHGKPFYEQTMDFIRR